MSVARRRRHGRRRGARCCRRGVFRDRVRPAPPILARGEAVGGGAGPPGRRVVGRGRGHAGVLRRAVPPRPRPPGPPRPRGGRRREGWAAHLRQRQPHVPARRVAALRGGGGGHAERNVPGGPGHRQRPLLGALRLQAVRAHRQRLGAARRAGAPAVQPREVVDEQGGDLRARALRAAQRLRCRRQQQQQLPVQRQVRVRQHVLLRGAGRGRAPPQPADWRSFDGGEGARGARVRAGADGRVPGRRRRGRPAGARHGQGVRAQRAARRRPRRFRQLLHVLQPRRPRPHQLRRRRPPRPGRDALHHPEHAPDVQHQRDGDDGGGEGAGGGVRRRRGLRHVLHLPQRPGVHGAGHQLRLPGAREEGQPQRLHPLPVLLPAGPRADGALRAGGEPHHQGRRRLPGHPPLRAHRRRDQRRPDGRRRILPRRAPERHRHRHHRPELHDRPQGGVRPGEVRPRLAPVRLLQGRGEGGPRREPRRGSRAIADDPNQAAAERPVPRRGARNAEAAGLRRQPPLLLLHVAVASLAGCRRVHGLISSARENRCTYIHSTN
ncbi:hypothetical protein VPH35_140586 [Triticum aestivum]